MVYETELYHYGIKGQKWGVRRFQRKDGTRTPAGKKRYAGDESAENTKRKKPLTTGQKVAIGAAATAAVLATVWGGYTVARAYSKQIDMMQDESRKWAARAGVNQGAKLSWTKDKRRFRVQDYTADRKDYMRKGMKKLFRTPVQEVLTSELRAQKDAVRQVKRQVSMKIAPSPFDHYVPKYTPKQILDQYRNAPHYRRF